MSLTPTNDARETEGSAAPAGALTPAPAVAGIALYSHDAGSLAYVYGQLLGRDLDLRMHADGREHWILPLGGVQLEVKALRTADGAPTSDAVGSEQPAGGTSRSELSLTVPDAAAAFELAIELGCTAHQPPEQYGWGTFATVLDPEGNRLGLFTPLAGDPAASVSTIPTTTEGTA